MRWQMHGASVMDIRSATQFKLHMEEAIKELSSALALLQDVYTVDQSLPIRKSVGDIMAAIDALLHESVYLHHPQLNKHVRLK
jgi:hypothetical protein